MLVTPQQAQLFLADMNTQSPIMQFTMTTHKQQAAFLDLVINLEEDASGVFTIQYRIYRKVGNAMAYLLDDSYHTPHTGPGMIREKSFDISSSLRRRNSMLTMLYFSPRPLLSMLNIRKFRLRKGL
jgi:hypothetical protein